MLRIREGAGQPRGGAAGFDDRNYAARPAGTPRFCAYGLLGVVLGAGGVVIAASLVHAEDDAGIRAFHREEAARRSGSSRASAYAPANNLFSLPLFGTRPDGRIVHPPIGNGPRRRGDASQDGRPGRYDTVSGAADVARTICVRLCDGYHMPIGHLRSQGDLKAHEALCVAQNPGIPVKLFQVPAGAVTIEAAFAADGKTYSALPVAYSYEKSADPACRPAIASVGERRVSLLRDITLRAGDAVVLDGRVTTFAGSSSWPYRAADFRDFRSAGELSAGTRRLIDEKVGITLAETQNRALRQKLRVREASHDRTAAPLELRGALAAGMRAPAPVRQVMAP